MPGVVSTRTALARRWNGTRRDSGSQDLPQGLEELGEAGPRHSGDGAHRRVALGAKRREGRTVLAVPGPITSPTSLGCNKLIQQGAKPALSPEDILQELGLGSLAASYHVAAAGQSARLSPPELTGLQLVLWRALQQEARHVDALVAAVDTGAGVAGEQDGRTEALECV